MKRGELTKDRPFHIDGDLHETHVRLLVSTGKSPYNKRRWSAMAALALLVVMIQPSWPFIVALSAISPLLLLYLLLPGDRRTLRLHFTANERRLNGRAFREGHADFQQVTIDGHRYEVLGGLSRKEHAQLQALLKPRERGVIEDVPQSITRLLESP